MSTKKKFKGRVVCTKAQFNALAEKDPQKEYLVIDEETDYASLTEQNNFTGINNFNAETNFNAEVNVDNNNVNINNGYLSTTDETKDLVTKYSADEVVIENGTAGNANTYNLKLPLKSGTLATTDDIKELQPASKEVLGGVYYWIDEEGIPCLSVVKIDKEDEPTPPTPTKEAGLYVDGVLSKTWAQLLSDGDVITHMEDTHQDMLMVANTSLQGDLVCDNAEGVTYLALGFEGCTALTSIDVSKLDTSKVEYMLFSNCSSLTSLDLSGFSTTKVADMTSMFDNCSGLTSLDVSNFDTTKVHSMSFMFSHCSSLTSLNLSNFNTSNVRNMNGMFSHCSSLTSLDLSSFDTTNVVDMRQLFSGCSGLTSLDLSGFSTSKVTNMGLMFSNCSSLTSLDISNFTFDKVTSYDEMFTNVPSDCEILVKSQTEKDWITSKFTNLTNVKIKGVEA